MIRIEFPADRKDIAAAIGRALLSLNGPDLRTSEDLCPGDCGANSAQIAGLDAAGSIDAGTGGGEAFLQAVVDGAADTATPDLAASLGVDDVAIGTRPGSVFEEPGNLPQIDPKGVAFHAAFCGIAAKPFYESGKQSGQWKKRKGVDQAAYDAWYAEQLAALGAAASAETAPVDTAGAFNGDGAEPVHTHAPTTCGDFMGWASKKQAAELLTQADITEAYATAGLVITDLFPPNDDAVIAERVAVLYAALSAKAGA
jgi:hypothetical protein